MTAWSDSEEEEEWPYQTRAAPARAPAGPPAAASEASEASEEEEGEEEAPAAPAATAADLFSPGAYGQLDFGGGLRQRRWDPASEGARPPGGFLFYDDGDFLLGSQRIEDPRAPGGPPLRQTLGLAGLALAIGLLLVALLCGARPDAASFAALAKARYGARNATAQDGASWLDGVLPADRSFDGHVAWSRCVDHGPFSLAIVALSVAAAPQGGAASPAPRKVYHHRYLGLLGAWLPLPYLPQPGRKPGTFGVGLCVLGRCACVPNPLAKSAPGAACWRFQGGKSPALNVMAIPNAALFFLWQWPGYWGPLAGHATLSLANLRRGRFWVLLSAPFSHRTWGEIFRSGLLLANALDSFDRAEVSFPIFLGLYLGGCWAAWLARTVLLQGVIRGDKGAWYAQEWGASGGLATQLLFLARHRPEERFSFSLYFVPMPVNLSAWQSLFAHGAVDLAMSQGKVGAEVAAHLAAWAFGWALYGAWARHA